MFFFLISMCACSVTGEENGNPSFVYIAVYFGVVNAMDFDKYIMIRIHHCGIIQNSFIVLINALCTNYSFFLPPQSLASIKLSLSP